MLEDVRHQDIMIEFLGQLGAEIEDMVIGRRHGIEPLGDLGLCLPIGPGRVDQLLFSIGHGGITAWRRLIDNRG